MQLSAKRLLLLGLLITLQNNVFASKADYKKADIYADDTAWYIGNWTGINSSFTPPVPVEISILSTGEAYMYIHGDGKSYKVTQGDKTISIDELKDRAFRGKVLNPKMLILEDGGKIEIAQTGAGLQTTVPELGVVVQYERPQNPVEVAAIEDRVNAQRAAEAHHKDHDFWHSEAFWNAVGAGVASAATDHDDHVEITTPSISKSDMEALQKLYPK